MRFDIRNKRALQASLVLMVLGAPTIALGFSTGFISPTGDGNYTQWSLGAARYTWVDEAIGCPGDTSISPIETWVDAGPLGFPLPSIGDRQSATIDISSIPDGASITGVDVRVCQSPTGLSAGGTFQTFFRMNSTNTDSGTNITTSGVVTNRTDTTQTIPLGPVTKTGAMTTLEIGVVKTGTGGIPDSSRRSVNVYTLAGSVTYLAADLAITKTDSPDPVLAGNDLTYTLTVTNNGPDDIPAGENIVVADTLPSGYTVTVPSGDGSYNTGTNIWTITGGLANGANATITLTVPVPSSEADGTNLSNTAAITSTSTTHPDTDSTNNSATATTTVDRSADLAVTIADAPDPVTAGGSTVYTVTLTNNGPSDASSVVVNIAETFPAGVTEGSVTPSSGTWASPVWTVGTLAAGASATLTLNVNVAANAAQGTNVISVTASAGGSEVDSNSANDSATASTSIQAAPPPASVSPIPTLQEWALMLMGLLLGGLVWYRSQRKGNMAA